MVAINPVPYFGDYPFGDFPLVLIFELIPRRNRLCPLAMDNGVELIAVPVQVVFDVGHRRFLHLRATNDLVLWGMKKLETIV